MMFYEIRLNLFPQSLSCSSLVALLGSNALSLLVKVAAPFSGVTRMIMVSSCDAGEANIEMGCVFSGCFLVFLGNLEIP